MPAKSQNRGQKAEKDSEVCTVTNPTESCRGVPDVQVSVIKNNKNPRMHFLGSDFQSAMVKEQKKHPSASSRKGRK